MPQDTRTNKNSRHCAHSRPSWSANRKSMTPKDQELCWEIKALEGLFLVVGHSNTRLISEYLEQRDRLFPVWNGRRIWEYYIVEFWKKDELDVQRKTFKDIITKMFKPNFLYSPSKGDFVFVKLLNLAFIGIVHHSDVWRTALCCDVYPRYAFIKRFSCELSPFSLDSNRAFWTLKKGAFES